MTVIDPEKIINKFIKQFTDKHKDKIIEIEGVLLFGSSLNPATMSKKSDVDLYIVIRNIGKRYRGVQRIDNIEVDYFINPAEQLKKDLETAKKNSKKTVIFMLAEGKILRDDHGDLHRMKKEAVKYLEDEAKKSPQKFQIIFTKYFIDDFLKDIEDDYENEDWFAFQYDTHLLLNYLIDSLCSMEKILITKPKYLKGKIAKNNGDFIRLYEEIEKTTDHKKRIDKLKKISKYVLNKIGGRLPDDWEMESDIIA